MRDEYLHKIAPVEIYYKNEKIAEGNAISEGLIWFRIGPKETQLDIDSLNALNLTFKVVGEFKITERLRKEMEEEGTRAV